MCEQCACVEMSCRHSSPGHCPEASLVQLTKGVTLGASPRSSEQSHTQENTNNTQTGVGGLLKFLF